MSDAANGIEVFSCCSLLARIIIKFKTFWDPFRVVISLVPNGFRHHIHTDMDNKTKDKIINLRKL